MLPAVAPIRVAALAPACLTAASGPVAAPLSSTGASSGPTITGATGIRVTIARNGAIAFSGPLRPCRFGCEPDDPTGARFDEIAVDELDEDADPEGRVDHADGFT